MSLEEIAMTSIVTVTLLTLVCATLAYITYKWRALRRSRPPRNRAEPQASVFFRKFEEQPGAPAAAAVTPVATTIAPAAPKTALQSRPQAFRVRARSMAVHFGSLFGYGAFLLVAGTMTVLMATSPARLPDRDASPMPPDVDVPGAPFPNQLSGPWPAAELEPEPMSHLRVLLLTSKGDSNEWSRDGVSYVSSLLDDERIVSV